MQGLRGGFPALLDKAPFLLPGQDVAIRPALERWFDAQRVRPRIVSEFDDSAMLKAFGQGGAGLFVAPTAIADYVCRQYDVRSVGRIESVVEQLYAITTERRMQHPAAVAIGQAASRDVFGSPDARSVSSGHGPAKRPRASGRRVRGRFAPESLENQRAAARRQPAVERHGASIVSRGCSWRPAGSSASAPDFELGGLTRLR